MQIFFDNTILEDSKSHVINDEESKHILRVLRKQIGDEIYLTNGKGTLFKTIIIEIINKKCAVEIIESRREVPPKTKLHIALSPPKSADRFEFFLEKATEIGISEITPILTKNSERKRLNMARCRKIIESAMKQSQRVFIPKLNELTQYSRFIKSIDNSNLKLIAHCEAHKKMLLQNIEFNAKDVTVLIGPEGDFDLNEIETALESNFQPVSLGLKRLRTETAGIYVCLAYQLLNK